jgi:hypothetical protein
MQNIYYLGVFLLTPLTIHAHDGEHITTAWYQEPIVIFSVVIGVCLLAFLGYGMGKKQKSYIIVPVVALMVLAVSSLAIVNPGTNQSTAELAVADFGAGLAVTLYKSPNCGCCSGHAEALEAAGFTVNIEQTNDLSAVKRAHNIPQDGESCHTSIIGDYVVEGHVPLEAIEKLVTEQPDIAGIGLAGMPIGTPGMPGLKTAPYEVYQLSESGPVSPYLTI